MGPQKGTTQDLATLSDLDESTLIDELHHRYKKNVIYVSHHGNISIRSKLKFAPYILEYGGKPGWY